jgi:hypothetical protein
MGFGTRQPTPNTPPGDSWAYGPQVPHDDFSALLNDLGARCGGCKRVTLNRFLVVGQCPECSSGSDIARTEGRPAPEDRP